MSWNGDEEFTDLFPVDTMVAAITQMVSQMDGICVDYRGSVLTCCQDSKECLQRLKNTLVSVKLGAAVKQDMRKACGTLRAKVTQVEECFDLVQMGCTKPSRTLLGPEFDAGFQNISQELHRHCGPDPTEVPETSTVTDWTTEFEGPGTFTSTDETLWFNSTSTPTLLDPGGNTSFPVDHGLTSHDVTVLAAAIAGGVMLLILLILAVIKLRQHYVSSEADKNCRNNETKGEKSYRWFHSSKATRVNEPDGEIYAEIDEKFMEAVYGVEGPQQMTDKHMTNAHSNACYSSELDAIITFNKGPEHPCTSDKRPPTKPVRRKTGELKTAPSLTPTQETDRQTYDSVSWIPKRSKQGSAQAQLPSGLQYKDGYDVASWVHQNRMNRIKAKTNYQTGSMELDTGREQLSRPVYDTLYQGKPTYVNVKDRDGYEIPLSSLEVHRYENEYQVVQ